MTSLQPAMATFAQNLIRIDQLDQLERALRREQIPMLQLKGAAFLDTLYDDLGARPMVDVDLLVRPQHRAIIGQHLEALGYSRMRFPTRPVTTDEHYEWVYLKARPFGLAIELHVALCQKHRFRVDTEGLWARSVEYKTPHRTVRTLSPADSLLYVSLHEAMHSFIIDHRSSEDIRRIIERWRPDWDEIVDRARAWQMTRSLYVSLLAAQRVAQAPIPQATLEQLRPSAPVIWLLDKLIDLRQSGRSRFERWSRFSQLLTMLLTTERPDDLLAFMLDYGLLRLRDAGRVRAR